MQKLIKQKFLFLFILFSSFIISFPNVAHCSIPGFYPNPVIEISGPVTNFLLPNTKYFFTVWLINKQAFINNEDGHSPKLIVEVSGGRITESFQGKFLLATPYGETKVIFSTPNINPPINISLN